MTPHEEEQAAEFLAPKEVVPLACPIHSAHFAIPAAVGNT